MKKLILFFITFSIVGAGIAQVDQYSPKQWYKTVKQTKSGTISDKETTHVVEVNPTVSVKNGLDIVVGETFYDLQSNSTMANRIYAFDDGTIATTWTRGMQPTSYPNRGTGYNYFDGTSWGEMPTERIEEQRTGWPNIASYGENGEIVCSHTFGPDGLVFSWRENKGEGEWQFFSLVGPDNHEDISWPRMITSGENNEIIHVICVTLGTGNGGTIYDGLDGALVYSRSDDGGETWNPENEILEGVSSDYTSGWGGDDYAWAQPVGDNIAFIAFGGVRDGVVMKSGNGGDDWERFLFYESPMPFFTGEEGDLPMCGGGDGYNAVVIDDEGLVHVAFGRQIHVDDDPAAGWSYYPYSDGLVYWNETMTSLDTAMIQSEILPEDWSTMNLYQNGNLMAWTQPHGEDTIVGVAYYGASLTSMPQLVAHRDEFGQKIIQVFYSALTVGFTDEDGISNYRHIWGRSTEGDGIYSEFTDYTDDIFHLYSECVYPSVAQTTIGDKFHILYQTDDMPGNSLQPTPPSHPAQLNNMVYLAVSPLPVDVTESVAEEFEVAQNVPNPAVSNTTINVATKTTGDINLSVSNLLGQVVHQETSSAHSFNVDVTNFDSGIYFYTIEIGNSSITKKMLVK